MSKSRILKDMINSNELEFIMEAHDGISAKIVEESGFKGIWASGLSMSASLGVRDNNELSFKEVADHCYYMSNRVSIPVLLDMDTGYGDYNTAITALNHIERAGVAGVVIEDKKFPKTNSFLENGEDKLEDPDIFGLKIKAMKSSTIDKDFVVCARVEAFIAGLGLDEAYRRASIYESYGADAIVMHSKVNTSKEVDSFIDKWKEEGHTTPVIIIPTKYYTTPTKHFRDKGYSMIIWANHNMRSAISSMQYTTKLIHDTQSLVDVEDKIATVKEIFRLQDNKYHEELEVKYSNSAPTTIILAASYLDNNRDNPLKCDVLFDNDETILDHQISIMGNSSKIVVLPYYRMSDKYLTVANKNYNTTTELESLRLADTYIKRGTVVSYGDITYSSGILNYLNNYDNPENYDIMFVVSDSEFINSNNYNEYLISSGEYVDETTTDYNYAINNDGDVFIGLFKVFSNNAVNEITKYLDETIGHRCRMISLIDNLIDRGLKVGVLKVLNRDWSDINTLKDAVRSK